MSIAGRVIINVGHRAQSLSESILGKFTVPGRGEPGAEERPYGVLIMKETYHEPHDRGWGEPSPSSIDGRYTSDVDGKKLAGWVVQAFYEALGRYTDGRQRKLGVFIAAGEEPTEAELDKARAEYLKELDTEFSIAHAAWNANHATRAINDHARLAVKVLGRHVEWSEGAVLNMNIPCPNCGELVPSTMAIHRRMKDGTDCGYVLDPEKAKRLVGWTPQENVKRRGTPDKAEATTG